MSQTESITACMTFVHSNVYEITHTHIYKVLSKCCTAFLHMCTYVYGGSKYITYTRTVSKCFILLHSSTTWFPLRRACFEICHNGEHNGQITHKLKPNIQQTEYVTRPVARSVCNEKHVSWTFNQKLFHIIYCSRDFLLLLSNTSN